MIGIAFVFLFQVLVISCVCCDGEYEHSVEQYIISCRSTDFACFQTQYEYLRDNVLLGCKELDVPTYQKYYFQYSDTNTCVRVSGVEASKLVGISFDGTKGLFSVMISMPVRFQQGWPNCTAPCQQPEKEFISKGPHVGPYKKFAGNATMVVQFPFKFEKKNDNFYMIIENEDLDVTLDVPDLSNYNRSNQLESQIYEWAEWAYEMVQHVDVPEHVMVPFMHQMKTIYTKLPLVRFILLYPSEKYNELRFKYVEADALQ